MLKPTLKRLIETMGYSVTKKDTRTRAQGNRFVFEVLKENGFEPEVIVDVGANRAAYAAFLSALFPHSEMYLFEPLSAHSSALDAFCRQHGNATWYPFGVGSANGILEFNSTESYFGETSTFSGITEGRRLEAGYQSITTEVVSLDHCLASGKIKQPDLLKIDTEGYELEVLNGATETLAKCKYIQLEVNEHPIGYLESSPTLGDVLHFCEKAGFRLYDFFTISYHPEDGKIWLMDIILQNDSL